MGICVCLQKVAERMEFSSSSCFQSAGCPCMLGRESSWAVPLHSFLAKADCHSGHWGALLPVPIRMTAETADGGGQLGGLGITSIHFSRSQRIPSAQCGHSRCAAKGLSRRRRRPGCGSLPNVSINRMCLCVVTGVQRRAFSPAVLSVSRKV